MQIKRTYTAAHLGRRLILNGKPFIGGCVLHDTAGSGTHNDTKYLANPSDGRTVSVDFTVERNGDIYQLNPDLYKFCTWHCGRATAYRTGNRSFRNRECTQVLIGIEIVQKAKMDLTPVWPPEQVKAVAELCLSLANEFKLSKEQITTHRKIITDGSRTDPRGFPFDTFWFYFNQAANVPAIDPPASQLGQPTIYEVVRGDSLWKIAKRFSTSIESIKALNGIAVASNLIRPGEKLIIRR